MTKKINAALSAQLAATKPRVRAIYVSTYPPRECGIATYTKDLTNAINLLNPQFLADIVAIDDKKSGGVIYDYPWEVKYKIDQESKKSWLDAAKYINQSGADIVVLEHEFGIYGTFSGEFAIPFIEAIKKPVTITFHTVLPKPNPELKKMVSKLGQVTDAIIVMVNTAAKRLVSDYGLDPKKIVVIPHGVPDIPFGPTEPHKEKFNCSNCNIIGGYGLISEGKGYEYAIGAMPEILKKHPNTKLLILGATHPVVKRLEGEKYRNSLKSLAKKLKVTEAICYIDRYLTLDEVICYLQAMDIYITPFPNLNQITSGTLAYAIGAGKACISTPYQYAKEVLSNNRGLLTEANNSHNLAQKAIYMLDHPRKRLEMAKNAYSYGRNMIWPSVALSHLDLFELLLKTK